MSGKRTKERGITLIELMVVIVVVAILGSLAVSSYRSYLLRANRTEATTALLRVQVAQEKFFLQNNRYADNDELASSPPGGLGIPRNTPSTNDGIVIDDYTATTYTAVATAANGQLQDVTACRVLSINQDGVRAPGADSGCWR
jgi:type IV pilus assembly protein PilE